MEVVQKKKKHKSRKTYAFVYKPIPQRASQPQPQHRRHIKYKNNICGSFTPRKCVSLNKSCIHPQLFDGAYKLTHSHGCMQPCIPFTQCTLAMRMCATRQIFPKTITPTRRFCVLLAIYVSVGSRLACALLPVAASNCFCQFVLIMLFYLETARMRECEKLVFCARTLERNDNRNFNCCCCHFSTCTRFYAAIYE